MKPGIYTDLTNEEYHSSDGISKSKLDLIARSPAHYKAALEAPRVQTEAFSIGTEAHRLILEPDTESLAVQKPIWTRRSKAEKQQWALFFTNNGADGEDVINRPAAEWDSEFSRQTGRMLLTHTQLGEIQAMRESVLAHPSACQLLEGGVAERSYYWVDEETGELCKCRPDYLQDDIAIVDLKTCDSADPSELPWTIRKRRYDVQDSFYSDGVATVLGLSQPPPFVFIFVEKTAPYEVATCEIDSFSRDEARATYKRDLSTYHDARVSNIWPAYPDDIIPISVPSRYQK